ncbi:MAG: hypothetical protein JNN15_10320 [Blastocatellia bacterium]|nr:hypothetical protein [Blastocatellia bacterium]
MKKVNGFTVLEALVIVAAGGILIAVSVSLYMKFLKIHQRQEGIITVDRELNSIQLALSQVLSSMPGRGIGYCSGNNYSVPKLPSLQLPNQKFNDSSEPRNGQSGLGKDELLLPLGIATPIKIKGQDAVTIFYGSRNFPRLELVEKSTEVNVGATKRGVALVTGTGNVQSFVNYFKEGSLMMLVGVAPNSFSVDDDKVRSLARVVKLIGRAVVVPAGSPQREAIQIGFDLCEGSTCSTTQFPQLINTEKQKVFAAGSVIVPLNITTFFATKEAGKLQVFRNDGGSLTALNSGTEFELVGGKNSLLGEPDSFTISYLLNNGQKIVSPEKPSSSWIDEIKAINVEVTKSLKLPFGNEFASRRSSVEYPLTVRTLE